MNFMIRLIITAIVAYLLSEILNGVHIKDLETAIFFALIFAILNAIVRPLLILFTLPLTILTMGLFLFVINAIIILLADYFLKGIAIDGFISAIIFSLLLSFISSVLNKIFIKEEDKK